MLQNVGYALMDSVGEIFVGFGDGVDVAVAIEGDDSYFFYFFEIVEIAHLLFASDHHIFEKFHVLIAEVYLF